MYDPRASVTVFIPDASPVLLSILAAASELEKRGGSRGRKRGELEKNKGEAGVTVFIEGPMKLKGCSLYCDRPSTRDLLCVASGTPELPGPSAAECGRL